jgi:hypothetical protein
MLLACNSIQTTIVQAIEQKPLVPTVPAGYKGFGITSVTSSTANTLIKRGVSASATKLREIVTATFDFMNISDPLISPDKNTQTYYLTGIGGNIYKSKNLKT